MKKRKLSLKKVLVLVLLLAACAWFINSARSYKVEATQPELTAVEQRFNEISSREDVKNRQHLIVKELYLMEERARVLAEKAAAIAAFDEQVDSFEKELEVVRAGKLSF